MVRILEVLVIELPVAPDRVPPIAHDADLAAVEGGVEIDQDLRAQIVRERLDLARERGEDHAAARRHVELDEPVGGHVEIFRQAALALDAAPERHADKIAVQAVSPLMIGTHELRRVAAQFAAELDAAMTAAVLQHVDRALPGPAHDHRQRADL